MANNKITGMRGLEDLPLLEILHMRGNQVKQLGKELDLPSLKYLNMRENAFESVESFKCLAGLKELKDFNVMDN